MNPELLAMLLARIDRLERIVCLMYDRNGAASDPMHCLRAQLVNEDRLYGPVEDARHRDAAVRMILEAEQRHA